MSRISVTFLCALVLTGTDCQPAFAQTEQTSPPMMTELQVRLVEIQKEAAEKYAALQRETEKKINALQAQIDQLANPSLASIDEPDQGIAVIIAPDPKTKDLLWQTAGDFRLRYENTSAHSGLPERNRGVLRARLGASYALNDVLTLGARITTGDPDDPNSSDVTMGNFFDDLEVSLDQVYVAFRHDEIDVAAGKFANPLIRTDLVWDSDVNPYGIAGRYALNVSEQVTAVFTGLFTIVDEQIIEKDSDMVGGQFSLQLHPDNNWNAVLGAGLYDYSIGSLNNAGPGDTRGNNLTPDGSAYLSDFNLLDIVARIEYAGLSEKWRLGLVADFVKNLGARVPEDTGFSLDMYLGQLEHTGDFLFRYGYAMAESDAVFAAFSNDNTTYSTNYQQHTLSADYKAFENVFLNLTVYKYRRDNFELMLTPGNNDYVARYRANLYFKF